MKIKDVEKQVGISKANIRFYEEEGLIHPARNQENNYREYSEADVEQLQEIKKLRLIGIPVQEIKDIYENFEGKEVFTSCLLGLKQCNGDNPCPIHHLAVAVKEKILIMFEYKIKDLKDLGSVMQMMGVPSDL